MPLFKVIRKCVVSEICIVEADHKFDAMVAAAEDDNVIVINDSSSDWEAYYPHIEQATAEDIKIYEIIKRKRKEAGL